MARSPDDEAKHHRRLAPAIAGRVSSGRDARNEHRLVIAKVRVTIEPFARSTRSSPQKRSPADRLRGSRLRFRLDPDFVVTDG
jgi:hypothetical protein